MPNMATWFHLDNLEDAIALNDKIGCFNKLCYGTRSWYWGPLMVYPGENPTEFGIEFNETIANQVWTVEATAINNPYGLVAALNEPLFSPAELALIQTFDIEGWTELWYQY